MLRLYQAQVRSCMEYCSHFWDGSAKCQFDALKHMERRVKKLINDDALVEARLQSLEHRRKVASLSVFYRIIYFGECAGELHNLTPPSPFHHHTQKTIGEASKSVADSAIYLTEPTRVKFVVNIVAGRVYSGSPGPRAAGSPAPAGAHHPRHCSQPLHLLAAPLTCDVSILARYFLTTHRFSQLNI
uniref:SFRICE_035164 n=1 Tax=Spodoptera frugiperda TaxID=7108 RepID=A0A2H1WT86_SPOFR